MVITVFFATMCSAAGLKADLVEELKPSVVNLCVSHSRYFGIKSAGQFKGTGFIADKKAGLIVTNRHVADAFPSQIKITFVDGASTLGKVIYYDATHDFSIVSFDPESVETRLEQVRFGDFFKLKTGDNVLLLGNNEGEEYSVKHGSVVDLVKDKGDRHSLTFQTSFDRTGGSSGSPVFNDKGEVVGLHFKGTDTSSFELPINYITDKLKDMERGAPLSRGEIGIQLELVKVADARTYLKFPVDIIKKLKKDRPDLKYFLMVNSVISTLPALQFLETGDIFYSVSEHIITDNMYLFDKLIDLETEKTVNLVFYRKGKKIKATIPVKNAENFKVKKFATFAGGTFHPITSQLRLSLDIGIDGVYISQAERGSTLGAVGYSPNRTPDRKGLVVTKINGHPIKNLDDLIKTVRPLKHKDKIAMTYKDCFMYAPSRIKLLILDLQTSPLTTFIYNSNACDWDKEK